MSKTPTHYEPCDYCHGTGDRPGGASYLAGAQACAWSMCIHCNGEGMVPVDYGCVLCLDTGVNVYDADFDAAHPQPCRYCRPATVAA